MHALKVNRRVLDMIFFINIYIAVKLFIYNISYNTNFNMVASCQGHIFIIIIILNKFNTLG